MKHTHARRVDLPFRWPEPPLEVALVEPEIPPNTGNIARLCAATASPLHLVEPLGFRLTDQAVRRAGLDYWDSVTMHRYPSLDAFMDGMRDRSFHLFSTRGTRSYLDVRYQPGDLLIFGNETKGLPDSLLDRHPDRVRGIPLRADQVRSLNLANAVSIALYEALRQVNISAG